MVIAGILDQMWGSELSFLEEAAFVLALMIITMIGTMCLLALLVSAFYVIKEQPWILLLIVACIITALIL